MSRDGTTRAAADDQNAGQDLPAALINKVNELDIFKPAKNLNKSIEKAKAYWVMAHMTVRNFTKWPLTNPQYFIRRGKFTHQPLDIQPGSQSEIITNKTDYAWFGCAGVMSWDIGTKQVMIFWNIPFERNVQGNKLGVGIKDTLGHSPKYMFKEIRSNKANYCSIERCSRGGKAIASYKLGGLHIHGEMDASRKPELMIYISAEKEEDYAENLRERPPPPSPSPSVMERWMFRVNQK